MCIFFSMFIITPMKNLQKVEPVFKIVKVEKKLQPPALVGRPGCLVALEAVRLPARPGPVPACQLGRCALGPACGAGPVPEPTQPGLSAPRSVAPPRGRRWAGFASVTAGEGVGIRLRPEGLGSQSRCQAWVQVPTSPTARGSPAFLLLGVLKAWGQADCEGLLCQLLPQ